VNDTELHARMAALADDLAPDADPYTQVAGARALHRRRQRTRLGVAGAAVAVALVAVGVPSVVGSLSAPGDGEVAGPSDAESLRGPADAVRSALAWWEEDGSVPDPGRGLSCSGEADLLAVDSRYPIEAVRQPGGSTTTACLWSTDGTGGTPPEQRVDLELGAAADLDAAEFMAGLDPDAGCPWTVLFTDRSPNVLQVCDGDGQRLWTLVVLDEDSTGAWTVTAAVGEELDAGSSVGARSIGALWGVVSGFDDPAPQPDGEPEITPVNQEFNEVVDLLDRREPLALAAGPDRTCPGGTARLEEALGTGLAEGPVPTALLPGPVCWWTAPPTPTSEEELADALSLAVFFEPGADDLSAGAWAGPATTESCLASEIPRGGSDLVVWACPRGGATSLVVTVLDARGTGLWTLAVQTPPESAVDPSVAALALVDVADRLW
jgi:hypothetical protein